jgi:hypothetical protein
MSKQRRKLQRPRDLSVTRLLRRRHAPGGASQTTTGYRRALRLLQRRFSALQAAKAKIAQKKALRHVTSMTIPQGREARHLRTSIEKS